MARRTLLHVFSTFSAGGPQIRFATLANHFGRSYRHVVIAMDGVTDAMRLVGAEVDLDLLPVLSKGENIARRLQRFAKILAQVQPDLLVTSNWGSIEWAIANLWRRVPHLHLEDGFGLEEAERQLLRRVWARRVALSRSTVLVPSRRLYDIARNVWRLQSTRLIYVPNGIDCDRFNRGPDLTLASQLGIRRDNLPIIGTVTRLSPEKNLRRLIEAFACLLQQRPALLVIVGDGPERTALSEHAAKLGIQDSIVFTGMYAHPERLLPYFTAFVISSDTEQMPLSVIEAMAAARPVVATDVGDIREMVADENRPFIVGKDVVALSTALVTLLRDPRKAAQIGTANSRRARELFDQRRMLAQYKALFDAQSCLPGNA